MNEWTDRSYSISSTNKNPSKKKINKFSTVVTPDPFLTLHPGS